MASFSSTADAMGVFFTFDQENLLPLSPVLAMGGPRAQVLVDSLPRVSARGTPLDPGLLATVGAATGLLVGGLPFANLVPGLPELYEQVKDVVLPLLPENPVPPWPFFADSAAPGGDPDAVTGFAPAFYGRATTTDEAADAGSPLAASAEGGIAALALPGSGGGLADALGSITALLPGGAVEAPENAPHVLRLGAVRSVASGTGGVNTAAEGLVEIADVSLLNGFIHFEGLRSHVTASATGPSTAEFDVENITVGGLPVRLTDAGFELLGEDQALGRVVRQISDALKNSLGLEFELLQAKVDDEEHTASAAALVVRFARQLLPGDIPGVIAAGEDRVNLYIGLASASADLVEIDVPTRLPDDGNARLPDDGTAVRPTRPPTGVPSSAGANTGPRPEVATGTRPAGSPLGLSPSSDPQVELGGVVSAPLIPDDLAFLQAGLHFRWAILPPLAVGLLGLYAASQLLRRVAVLAT